MTLLRGADKYLKIWVAIVLVLLVTVAGLLYLNSRANTALRNSRAANMKSQYAVDCLNNTLAARAAVTARDNDAHVAFQNADAADAKAFAVLLEDILTSAPSSRSTPDFLAYIKVNNNRVKVSQATSQTLQADQEYRDKHPLGKC